MKPIGWALYVICSIVLVISDFYIPGFLWVLLQIPILFGISFFLIWNFRDGEPERKKINLIEIEENIDHIIATTTEEEWNHYFPKN